MRESLDGASRGTMRRASTASAKTINNKAVGCAHLCNAHVQALLVPHRLLGREDAALEQRDVEHRRDLCWGAGVGGCGGGGVVVRVWCGAMAPRQAPNHVHTQPPPNTHLVGPVGALVLQHLEALQAELRDHGEPPLRPRLAALQLQHRLQLGHLLGQACTRTGGAGRWRAVWDTATHQLMLPFQPRDPIPTTMTSKVEL